MTNPICEHCGNTWDTCDCRTIDKPSEVSSTDLLAQAQDIIRRLVLECDDVERYPRGQFGWTHPETMEEARQFLLANNATDGVV